MKSSLQTPTKINCNIIPFISSRLEIRVFKMVTFHSISHEILSLLMEKYEFAFYHFLNLCPDHVRDNSNRDVFRLEVWTSGQFYLIGDRITHRNWSVSSLHTGGSKQKFLGIFEPYVQVREFKLRDILKTINRIAFKHIARVWYFSLNW